MVTVEQECQAGQEEREAGEPWDSKEEEQEEEEGEKMYDGEATSINRSAEDACRPRAH